jgi:hypothetical protein
LRFVVVGPASLGVERLDDPRVGQDATMVCPSGQPIRRSVSTGVRRRTLGPSNSVCVWEVPSVRLAFSEISGPLPPPSLPSRIVRRTGEEEVVRGLVVPSADGSSLVTGLPSSEGGGGVVEDEIV